MERDVHLSLHSAETVFLNSLSFHCLPKWKHNIDSSRRQKQMQTQSNLRLHGCVANFITSPLSVAFLSSTCRYSSDPSSFLSTSLHFQKRNLTCLLQSEPNLIHYLKYLLYPSLPLSIFFPHSYQPCQLTLANVPISALPSSIWGVLNHHHFYFTSSLSLLLLTNGLYTNAIKSSSYTTPL